MVELDNLHYDFRAIDGYNKAFCFILSPRELGKTTMCWLKKIYLKWKENKRPWIYLVRKSVEISEALIDSVFDTIINKFTDDNVRPKYAKGSFKEGIVDVYIGNEIFFRIVSLGIDLRRIKLAVLKNIGGVIMDEYIIDPKTKEKYTTNEAFKLKEAYTTWRREAQGLLRVYILANPYSLYNPLFLSWNVDLSKLKRDSFYVGDTFVIHWAVLSEELREHLLEVNPLYQFDEDYNSYALDGNAINDKNIKLGKLPQNYYLKYCFKVGEKYLGVYENSLFDMTQDKFFVQIQNTISQYRQVYCFDFNDLVEGTQILSKEERFNFSRLKDAIRTRRISFENINTYYLLLEVYEQL